MDAKVREFWDFALAVYARAGVAPRCIELQDRHGANVMLLLFACWCATRGSALDAVAVADAAAAIDVPDRHLVRPLRAARRVLAQAARALASDALAGAARNVQAAELEVERGESVLLAHRAPAAREREGTVLPASRGLELALLNAGLAQSDARHAAQALAGHMLPGTPGHS